MDLQLADWLSLIVRWLHVIFGVAWIGTSFYFNWLNNSVRTPEKPRDGVSGELWAIHGGDFFLVSKYDVAPARLPRMLHWFKWEAYLTWITGFSLLAIVYYFDTGLYLRDATVSSIGSAAAIGVGIGTLVVGWVLYDLLCKSPLIGRPITFTVFTFLLATGAAYGLTRVFGSRAAYIHVGAMLGTIMAANVFFVIIPNQKITVAAMSERKTPDPKYGRDAARRSLHNNYITLPVLFIMVSNHYPMTYGHEWNWAVLAALSLIGAATRHHFNLKGRGEKNVWILPGAAVAMLALAFVMAPRDAFEDAEPVSFEEVRAVIEVRCVPCHSASPTHGAFPAAPLGLMYDTPQQIRALAPRIYNTVWASRTMPLGNLTQITEEERFLIGAWFYQGARLE